MRIMIIDDEWHGLNLLENILTSACTEVSITGKFQNPLEAIPYILASEPEVVIIDVEMPFVNGLDMVRMFEHKGICFIITSVMDADEMRMRYNFRNAEFISKPYQATELCRAINRLKNKFLTNKHS